MFLMSVWLLLVDESSSFIPIPNVGLLVLAELCLSAWALGERSVSDSRMVSDHRSPLHGGTATLSLDNEKFSGEV